MSSEFMQVSHTQRFVQLNQHPSLHGIGGLCKRLVDMTLASFGSLLLLPVFLVISLLIMRDSPGPIFFRQRRVGLKKQEFWMYKFRSPDFKLMKQYLIRPAIFYGRNLYDPALMTDLGFDHFSIGRASQGPLVSQEAWS